MPPKRTRGGAVKATNARKPNRVVESSSPEPEAQESAAAEHEGEATQDVDMATVSQEPAEASHGEQQPATQTSPPANDPAPTNAPSSARGRAPRGGMSSRGGAGSASSPPARAKKVFQPRFTNRRSKEEREAIARAEEAREAEARKKQEELKQKELRMQRMKQGWNNNRRGQGRGGYMGERKSMVSGPFSAGTVEGKVKVHVPHRKSGAVRGQRERTAVKKETSGPADREGPHIAASGDVEMSEVKEEGADGEYISSDEDDEIGGPRKDVDFINLLSDEEDGFAPIRINRVEHRDRVIGINTDPSAGLGQKHITQVGIIEEDDNEEPVTGSVVGKGKPRAKDVEVVQSTRKWRGVYDDEDEEVQVKDEPNDEEDITAPEPVTAAVDDDTRPPPSIEGPRKPLHKDKGKARRFSGLERKPPVFQTAEEGQEWNRHQTDLLTLREELGTIDLDDDADAAMDSSRSKADAVYLFQFPPILPDLTLASEGIKKEGEGDTTMTDAPPPAQPAATVKAQDKTPIKIEDDGPSGTAAAVPGPSLTSGMMGKLRVHKSGKVTLDWGGTSMQLHMGLDASFLQDAVLTKVPLPGALGAAGEGGEAMALGPVRGKFVVTPDWEQLM